MFVYPIWGSRGVRRCCRSAAAACVQMNAVSMAHANAVLQSTFKIPHLRYIQPDIVSGRLRGLDVLALMPTGGGKSLCFQLPALCHEGTTIVVLPLLSLMHDRLMALQQRGVPAMVWNSESSNASKPGLLHSANACELVYTTLEQFESEDLRCWTDANS